jgi:hypothetical protein
VSRDRRLHDVGAAAAERQRAVEDRPALRDLLDVPERAILVAEEDDGVVGEARLAPRVVDQHQGQQPLHLRLVGHQPGERAAEPDRLAGELAAAAVPLVEDQVHDREHRGETVGQQVVGRDAERDPGGLDLPLRADEPLRHRRLGDEEGAGDLVRRQPAERPQRERDLSLEREGWMAAGEDQLEALVGDRLLVHVVLPRFRHVQ